MALTSGDTWRSLAYVHKRIMQKCKPVWFRLCRVRLRDQFIQDTLEEARRLAQSGNREAALDKFAEACHPIMDSSSPMHVDPNGFPRIWSRWRALGHSPNEIIGKETLRELNFEILNRQRILLNIAYEKVFGP